VVDDHDAARSAIVKLLLYAGADETGQRLRRCIDPLASNRSLEACGTIDSLIRRLRQPIGDLVLAVILATSRAEFDEIVGIGRLLEDIRTIIIVPDRRPETISAAHKLHPRLISSADEDFKDLAEVVAHMLERLSPQN
jgi:hypothetical protein